MSSEYTTLSLLFPVVYGFSHFFLELAFYYKNLQKTYFTDRTSLEHSLWGPALKPKLLKLWFRVSVNYWIFQSLKKKYAFLQCFSHASLWCLNSEFWNCGLKTCLKMFCKLMQFYSIENLLFQFPQVSISLQDIMTKKKKNPATASTSANVFYTHIQRSREAWQRTQS